MAAQFESILEKLTLEEREQIQSVLKTIAMQAEIIKEMSHDLMIYDGSASLQNSAMTSATLAKLGEILKKPYVKGPSVEEINQSLDAMRVSIENAKSEKEAFETIFSFAIKIAPLLLV